MSAKDRFWRTLIRVTEINPHYFLVVIPGWNSEQQIPLDFTDLPENIRPLLAPNFRLHALVNTGVEHADELEFKDWEIDSEKLENESTKFREELPTEPGWYICKNYEGYEQGVQIVNIRGELCVPVHEGVNFMLLREWANSVHLTWLRLVPVSCVEEVFWEGYEKGGQHEAANVSKPKEIQAAWGNSQAKKLTHGGQTNE